jgi:erythromycin esterase
MTAGIDNARSDITQSLHAVLQPLATVEPGGGRADLEPFLSEVADADVVGHGEGSHGTREFTRFKDRLLRAMIEGLRLIGLETNFAATLAVEEHVTSGGWKCSLWHCT